MRVRKLVRTALTYLGYLVAALIVMFIAIYVETNARDLELPLARAGGLIAIIGAVVWWRVPKRLQWLTGWLFIIGSAALLLFATLDGWGGVVVVAYSLSLLAIIVAATVLQLRALRRLFPVPPELALEASQPLSPDAREETNAVCVYPSKRRLVQALIIMAATLASCGGLGAYAYAHPDWPNAAQVLVLTSAVCALTLLAMLIVLRQLIRPQLLFTLSEEGIHLRKMTLVRWREIVGMYILGQGSAKSWSPRRTLVLRVAHPEALISRQPRRSQWALRLGNSMFGSPVAISEQQLPMSLEVLQERMVPYLERAHGLSLRDEEADTAQD